MALHRTGLANEYIIQDFGIPSSAAGDFIRDVTTLLPACQLFLCPGQSIENFGVLPQLKEDFIRRNRELAELATKYGGFDLLYAQSYVSEDDFWARYNRHSYNEMRLKYKAEIIPDMFQKVQADMQVQTVKRPITGTVKTVLEVLVGRARKGRAHN